MSKEEINNGFFIPQWPAPAGVQALITTRQNGVSIAPYGSFNLGDHVGDDPDAVRKNRQSLRSHLPGEPVWLSQVHGTHIVNAGMLKTSGLPLEADACITRRAGVVCVVMTADCLPVLFTSMDGTVVAAAHAGWRGLCAGILEKTLAEMAIPANQVMAYLGPAIGPAQFEAGGEVREAFMRYDSRATKCFVLGLQGRWMADIFELARQRLISSGLLPESIYGGEDCTVSDSARFYSYRRDKMTGRMASLIWHE